MRLIKKKKRGMWNQGKWNAANSRRPSKYKSFLQWIGYHPFNMCA